MAISMNVCIGSKEFDQGKEASLNEKSRHDRRSSDDRVLINISQQQTGDGTYLVKGGYKCCSPSHREHRSCEALKVQGVSPES